VPPDVPVLVYDGRCRFCVRSVGWLRARVGDRIRYESFRDPGVLERHPELTAEQCERGAQLVEPGGRVWSDAGAVLRALATRPAFAPVAWLYAVPGLRGLLERGYRVVARNRMRIGGEVCADDACGLHPGR